MHSNARIGKSTILVLGFVLTLAVSARAQNSAANSRRVAPVVFLESTKEQDGLVGPVRRVQTEIAKLETRSGKVAELQRQLLEVTTYDLKGQRTDNASYPVGGTSGKEEYKYDENGNIVEMTLRGDDGSIMSRETYQYQIDGVGNWTKMITNLVVFEDGKLRYEPVEVTYRTITYYYDQKIAKLIDATSSKGSTATGAQESTVPATTETTAPALTESTVSASPGSTIPGSAEPSVPLKTDSITSAEKDSTAANAKDTSAAVVKDSTTTAAKNRTAKLPKNSNNAIAKNSTVPSKDSTTGAAKDSTTAPANDSAKAATHESVVPESSPKLQRSVVSPTPSDPAAAVGDSAEALSKQPASDKSDVPEGSRTKNPASSSEGQPNRVEVSASAHDTAAASPTTAAEAEATKASPPTAHKAAYEAYRTGRQRFDEGDITAAVDAYQQSLQLEPDFADVYLSLGHAYLRLNKSREAVKAFKEAVRLNPNMEEAQYGLGLEYFRMHNMKDAAAAFKKAVAARPDMAKAHYGLALAYQEMEKPDLLLEEYRILQGLDAGLAKKLSDSFPDFNLPCGGRRCR